ncbi:MAG: hypothetical protein BGO98_35650 [Myxococcales bacterium 68-20]|nr:hypothetical protein [Myxococcales bacterium]OJY25932.1 MAG: hypothetical protein BGO98_35650 [Myxococcales bacterium 68-20]
MKDPSPLLDDELPEEIASMLRAADEDVHPNPAAQSATLMARFGEAAPPMMPTLTQRFGSLRAAVVYTGLAAAVGLAAFGWHASSDELGARAPSTRGGAPSAHVELPAPTPRVAPIAAVSPIPPANDVQEPASALPSIDVSALPPSPREPRRAPSPAPGGSSARFAPSSLAAKAERSNTSLDDELARIDRARGLLASGKPSDTLVEVKAYRREYSAQSFADEADSLEVRALAALGRTSEARALAEQFLTKRPGSPYAEPVRAAVGMTR